MTLNEINNMCAQLGRLNEMYWRETGAKKRDLLCKFRATHACLKRNGYRAVYTKRWVNDLTGRHVIVEFSPKAIDASFAYTDNRDAEHTGERGDCTTRAIATCLNMPYKSIRDKQIQLTDMTGVKWNRASVWTKILFEQGWQKIKLQHKITRRKLASLAKGRHAKPIAAHSRGHVAAIMDGKVLDTWDSTGGRVDYIIVSPEDTSKLGSLLGHATTWYLGSTAH